MTRPAAIGFFDSGIGGFSVMRHALESVEGVALHYVADSRFAPYGGRSPDFVLERCYRISRFLVEQGAGAIVVACNTATAIAIDVLRDRFDIPIIGMEPGIKPAATLSRTGHIAVLATDGTLNSVRYARLLSEHARGVTIHPRACHHWVEAVEAGELDTPEIHELVEADVAPLRAQGVDTYVLGCTHFPFLRAPIMAAAGQGAELIDPGPAVVEQLRRRIGVVAEHARTSPLTLHTTGSDIALAAHASRLLGRTEAAHRIDP